MEGNGEILHIEARPTDGERDLTIDKQTGLIDGETFKSLPEPYRVARYGSSKNQLAMTFDDGPDPQWTPKILDVLKREHVPGTFFLIGIQAEKFSSLTQRIYREGHEIGNHTFTHPDISSIGSGYMKVELNLTERLFASRLGIHTMLFRPPYSVDAEPDTEDEVRPLELTQNMGYITIGNKIDTRDWNDEPALSPKQIAARGARPPASLPSQRYAVRQHHSHARWRRQPGKNRARPPADHRRRSCPRISICPRVPVDGQNESGCHAAPSGQRVLVRAAELDRLLAFQCDHGEHHGHFFPG